MAFTGKATFDAGSTLPEIAEDLADVIGIVSPHETPLLDALGDPQRSAASTRHEWLEDALLPNTDAIDDGHTFSVPSSDTSFDVENIDRFRIGDQVRAGNSQEVLLVTAKVADAITVVRGYGSTTPEDLSAGQALTILGNAALEGDDMPTALHNSRVRKSNYTQIFTAGVEVSGTELAVRHIGVDDEMDYQKSERLREQMRDLENCVINGVQPAATQEGDATTRRSMRGILSFVQTNIFEPGVSGFPSDTELTEEQLNTAMREVWNGAASQIDTIVVNGLQKRRINQFIASNRRYGSATDRFRDLVSVYESDYGICRVVLSRWVPSDAVLLLDSSRIDVMPLAGRSFHFKRFTPQGDREAGQVIGEYTLQLMNESAHGVLRGLA